MAVGDGKRGINNLSRKDIDGRLDGIRRALSEPVKLIDAKTADEKLTEVRRRLAETDGLVISTPKGHI